MFRSIFLTLTIISLVALMLDGCHSSDVSSRGELRKPGEAHQIDTSLEILRPALDVQPIEGGDYEFIFSAGASGRADDPSMVALRSIQSVSFTVLDPRGRTLDSLVTTEIPTSGVVGESGVGSLTATAHATWHPKTAVASGTSVEMWVQGTDGGVMRAQPIRLGTSAAVPRREPLRLVLDVESVGSRARFRLEVERLAPGPPDEFLPTGELFRIEILDDHGEQVWSSSTGRMFTQALQPVQPARVGEKVTYAAEFNGIDERTHGQLPAGRYTIVGTIPAKPHPYRIREEMDWGGSR